jgi:hypothetical protein
VTKWYTNHPRDVTESSATPETLANGFRASGLYPLNPNALDYSKCLGTSASAFASTENSINTEDELGTAMNYTKFVKIIGKENIEKFKRIKDFLSGENENFFTMFCMWEYFQNGREEDTFSDSTDGKIQNEKQSLMFNGNDLDIPTGTMIEERE